MNGWYFYTAIIGFMLGIAGASLYSVSFEFIVLVVMLSGVVWWIAYRESSASSVRNLFLISLFLISSSVGMVRLELFVLDDTNAIFESQLESHVVMQGVVTREPDMRENSVHLYVQVSNEIILVKTSRHSDISYGDLIQFEGRLVQPQSFETDLGRVFDYPMHLRVRNVSYMVNFAKVELLETGHGNVFISYILIGKNHFVDSIKNILPEPELGLAQGLLLGMKQSLGEELEDAFITTGIIHIVVLSGYNVMLVVIFITYMLSYILPFRARMWFGIGAIISFAIMVGLSATVVRASIMAALILIARNFGHSYAVIRALAFAGFVMVVLNPHLLLHDVGFQLSFLATFGLVMFSPYIEKYVTFMPSLLHLREFLTATLATQLFIMPILLYSIGEFSVVSVVVNVLVLPMVPVAMLLTFITGIVGLLSVTVASLIGFIAYLSLSYIVAIAVFFAQIPFASFTVPAFSFWVVVISYVLIGYLLYRLHQKPSEEDNLISDELFDWEIEDEQIIKKRLEAESLRDSASNQLPTFYR